MSTMEFVDAKHMCTKEKEKEGAAGVNMFQHGGYKHEILKPLVKPLHQTNM